MTHGMNCTCYDCLVVGDTRCSTKCVLRFGHAGPHVGWLAFARMFVRELRRRVGHRIAGRASG